MTDHFTFLGPTAPTHVVVNVWMDLQIPVQTLDITTKVVSLVVSLNPADGEAYLIQNYVIKCVSDLRQVGGFS
jgi:hypothetical protein